MTYTDTFSEEKRDISGFLCLNAVLFSFSFQAKISDESIFKTMYEENYFHTFTSHKYFKKRHHDLFLGIKQNGRCKSPKLTYPGQISVQFVLLPNNNTEEKARIMSHAKQNPVRHGKRDMS